MGDWQLPSFGEHLNINNINIFIIFTFQPVSNIL